MSIQYLFIRYACAIPIENFLIVTGGGYAKKTVTKYDEHGPMDEDLPLLNHGRHGHACGFFHSNNELVLFKY